MPTRGQRQRSRTQLRYKVAVESAFHVVFARLNPQLGELADLCHYTTRVVQQSVTRRAAELKIDVLHVIVAVNARDSAASTFVVEARRIIVVMKTCQEAFSEPA